MLDEEKRRTVKNPSKEDSELRNFAWKIIRGDSENRYRRWLRRARRRHIEVQADWLKTKDEEEMLGNKVWLKKEDR